MSSIIFSTLWPVNWKYCSMEMTLGLDSLAKSSGICVPESRSLPPEYPSVHSRSLSLQLIFSFARRASSAFFSVRFFYVFFVLSKCIKLRYIFSEVIVKLRKLFCFDLLYIALEYSFFASQLFCLILLRECNLNFYVITGLSTDKLLLESRDEVLEPSVSG